MQILVLSVASLLALSYLLVTFVLTRYNFLSLWIHRMSLFVLLSYMGWAAYIKITWQDFMMQAMENMGYPHHVTFLIGCVETLFVSGALLGIIFKNHVLKNFSVLNLLATSLCAVSAHIPHIEQFHWLAGFGLVICSMLALLTDKNFKIQL